MVIAIVKFVSLYHVSRVKLIRTAADFELIRVSGYHNNYVWTWNRFLLLLLDVNLVMKHNVFFSISLYQPL